MLEVAQNFSTVIPAKAGISVYNMWESSHLTKTEMPAFAGMTNI